MDKSDKAFIERAGVIAAADIFNNDFKWFFREQGLLDWGIEAQVEQVEEGLPTGKLFALQIKCGRSYFKKQSDDFVYYGEMKHLDYWSGHSLPVYLILHNPDTKLTLWQRVSRQACTMHEKSWSIAIPACNVLDAKAKAFFEVGVSQDDEGSRRLRFAMDRELMEKIGDDDVYFVWEDWVNKSLGLRNLTIYIGYNPAASFAGKKEPDVEYPMWYLATHDIALAMSVFFPWVEYEYAAEVQSDSEVEGHILEAHLTDAAKGYVAAKNFREGSDWKAPEADYEDDEQEHSYGTDYDDYLAQEEEEYRREEEAKAKGTKKAP